MAGYAMIAFAFMVGGAIAYIIVRIFFRFFDSMERFPPTLRVFIALIVLTAVTSLLELLALDATLPVSIAFSVGFGLVFYFYEPRLS